MQRDGPPLGFDPFGEPGRIAAVPAAGQLVDPCEQAAGSGERPVAVLNEVGGGRPLAGLDLANLGAGVADLLAQLFLAQSGRGPPAANLRTKEI